jgi:hypothetical protein
MSSNEIPPCASARIQSKDLLWQTDDSEPRVWHQSGDIPATDVLTVEKISLKSGTVGGDGRWACLLSKNGKALGILEVYSGRTLSISARTSLEKLAQIGAVRRAFLGAIG